MRQKLIHSNRLLKPLLISLTLFFLDRLLKNIYANQTSVLINPGVAFGILPQFSGLVTGFGFLFLLVIFFRNRRPGLGSRLGFFLIGLGGFSNLLDRFIYHGVIDYLRITDLFPRFNLADVLVVVGVGIMIGINIKDQISKISKT